MRLITIPMSHYCEKARWGLIHADLEHVEDAHLQGLHYLAVRGLGSGGLVPVLMTADGPISDSSKILQWIDRRLPPSLKLYPAAHEDTVRRWEQDFDAQLGVETRRWIYFHWFQRSNREIVAISGQKTPAFQRLVGPALFPMARRVITRKFGISAENVRQGLPVIDQAFDRVEKQLSDGRPFLFGDQFTAADLCFACLAAPVLLPRQYGIRLPTLDEAPASARADIQRYSAHPAGKFALHLFEQHRQPATRTGS